MTSHQATRSKDLAENALESIDYETGAVIPINFVEDKFVHFTADNIDNLDETLDGKIHFMQLR